MVVVVVDIGYMLWWWHMVGGNGGDSFCKGGSCNSFRTAIVRCMMCGEGSDDCDGDGGGTGSGRGRGQGKNHHNHY